MYKSLILIIIMSISLPVQSSIKSTVEIKTVFQECYDSAPVPMSDVSISLQIDKNAEGDDFICESKVDKAGIAKCYINDSCDPSPIKLYNQVKIKGKKHFNLSANNIELVVVQCDFIKPPVVHEVVFSHSQCTNYDRYLRNISMLKVSKNSLINFGGEEKAKLFEAVKNNNKNIVEKSIKDALNLAKIYRDSAELFTEDSEQYRSLKEKETFFTQSATLIMNTWISDLAQDKIPNIVASASLSDYYNNMNHLRANQTDLLSILLPNVDLSEQNNTKLKVDRLFHTKELNFEAINALNEIKNKRR